MDAQGGYAPFLFRLARTLHEASGWEGAVSAAASEIASLAPHSTILLFLLDPEGKLIECVYPPPGGRIEGRALGLDCADDPLVRTLAGVEPVSFPAEGLKAEAVRHLSWSGVEPPGDLTVVPLRHRDRSVGVLELVGPAPQPGEPLQDASLLQQIGSLLGASAVALRERERKDLGRLEALTRLTQLYDIGRTFNSTLELDELLPLVVNRVANILQVEQCNIWLLEKDASLHCAAAHGPASNAVQGSLLAAGEGVPGQVAASGKDVLVADAKASRRTRRRREVEAGMEVYSLAAALLEANGRPLGVLEVLNRTDGERLARTDLTFLKDLASQAASALHNARLLQAERKVGQLHALLEISREATSTLDLGRVLAAIVNRGSTLLPYERAAIGLREKGSIRVAAVSGTLEVDPGAESILLLSRIVRWAAERKQGIYLSLMEGNIVTDVPGAREKFGEYFEKSGMKSFLSLPLSDEEGSLGILTMESPEPYFLSEAQLELAQILALQATVAIRNARLYQQVPLISVMEPLIRRKEAWLRLPRRKRLMVMGVAAAVAASLVLVPWRLRVGGAATVMPYRSIAVSAEVQGTVEQVLRREGDRVAAGEVIAQLQDLDTRMSLARARADLDIARREKSRLEAALQLASAQMEAVRVAQLEEEAALLERKAEKALLRAPAPGIILTPRIEQKTGTMLHRGDAFCHLADTTDPTIELQIPEQEIGGIRVEMPVWVKVAAYPSRTFHGVVYQVGARAAEGEEGRCFTARARMQDGDVLRPGMSGRGKVLVGTYSVGYVVLRRPARWIWAKVWPWLP